MSGEREARRVVVGRVVSDKMQKTVVVELERQVRHAAYGKTVRRRTRVKAHDAEDACHVGDVVRLMETRPLSREKRWRVVEIVERAV
ncbi:MAG TPA: 30S ribosomal protein S17 [Candidatus Sulfotelmatobacter sp.]|nr:30S ribosomal protein S17 [Candidatus Sulfotelmatobacter sp.]